MAGDVTALIEAASGGGDACALQALFERVYDELKVLARRQLASSGSSTLNTTALVHEAYVKLAGSRERELHGRAHFFALTAKAMRQIVIDHARARATEKRGGHPANILELDAAADVIAGEMPADELLRLDRALTLLESEEPRLAKLVELRFFGGLGIAEISLLQAISPRTLNRDWRRAKAHIYVHMHPDV